MYAKNYLWTAHHARLQLMSTRAGKMYHWIFLPGGPGLGSEYFHGITRLLDVPGCIWHLDLPGNGSNKRDNGPDTYAKWTETLLEAVKALESVILVAHSVGGMLALACPELEKELKGLVLLNTSPSCVHREISREIGKDKQLPDREKLLQRYLQNPSEEAMRQYCQESIPYWFTPQAWQAGRKMVEDIPLNYQAYQAGREFLARYQALWVPQHLKTLIIMGTHDFVTPPCVFEDCAKFHRPNIWLNTIQNASHFCWVEEPKQVAQAFEQYSAWLDHRFQPS